MMVLAGRHIATLDVQFDPEIEYAVRMQLGRQIFEGQL